LIPGKGELDVAGLDLTEEQLEGALSVDREAWTDEAAQIATWFDSIGDSLPTQLTDELGALVARLSD
jgi:phosphoenolpyruvate carboxykinase (GTP)